MKQVFVTVGTTLFDELIDVVDDLKFHQILSDLGYDRLLIQIGNYTKKSLKYSIKEQQQQQPQKTIKNFESYYYDYKATLQNDMENSTLIISHGGSGSLLETLSIDKPCVELANKLGELGYILPTVPDQLSTVITNQLKQYLSDRMHLQPEVLKESQQQFSKLVSDQFPTRPESSFPSSRNSPHYKNRTMVILGSGGHTAEMFYLLSDIDKSKFPTTTYVLANTDKRSLDKIYLHHNLTPPSQQSSVSSSTTKDSNNNNFTIKQIPRSRNYLKRNLIL
eukprot:gene5339-6659_t